MRAVYLPMRHPDSDNFDPAEVYRWLGAAGRARHRASSQ